ncbi:unnamed protein product, partial [Musa textilis]
GGELVQWIKRWIFQRFKTSFGSNVSFETDFCVLTLKHAYKDKKEVEQVK